MNTSLKISNIAASGKFDIFGPTSLKRQVKRSVRIILAIFPGILLALPVVLFLSFVFPGFLLWGIGIYELISTTAKLSLFDLTDEQREHLQWSRNDTLEMMSFPVVYPYVMLRDFANGKL